MKKSTSAFIAAVLVTGLMVGVLLLDKVEPLHLVEVLVPFVSSSRPLWTGVGIIAFYLSILVTVTFYIRKRISMKTFRKIHYLSIVAFPGALFHGLYAGTDSALHWTQIMYWGTFLSAVFFGMYWLVPHQFKVVGYLPHSKR